MPENLENSAVATGLEKVSFIPIPKKGHPSNKTNQAPGCCLDNKIVHVGNTPFP